MEGTLLKIGEDRILLLANQVGYEVMLPTFVMETVRTQEIGDQIALYIFFQQIGFNLEAEKEFFQHFISVEDIGPLKAVKAMTIPVRDIARAIEAKDLAKLKQLKGIGNRTAQKIVATLSGKMDKFALIRKSEKAEMPVDEDITSPVIDVLVSQLGHKIADAKQMIVAALERDSSLSTPEELFDEVYRGEAEK
jgi:Holliday junction DNA helicase RuvA